MRLSPTTTKRIIGGLVLTGIAVQLKNIRDDRIECLEKCREIFVSEALVKSTALKSQKDETTVRKTLIRYAKRSCELRCKYKSLKEKKELLKTARKEVPEYVFRRRMLKLEMSMAIIRKKWFKLIQKASSIGAPELARAARKVIR